MAKYLSCRCMLDPWGLAFLKSAVFHVGIKTSRCKPIKPIKPYSCLFRTYFRGLGVRV